MQIKKMLTNALHSKALKGHIDKSISSPKFLTRTLLLTSVSKDVFAYALRVHNAHNNEDIPKDKRGYVVKMDAVTGVTTGVVQVATGFLVSNDKIQNKVTDKLFKSIANDAKALKYAKGAFSTLSTMIIATLLAKRVIVPFISSKITSSPLLANPLVKVDDGKKKPVEKITSK